MPPTEPIRVFVSYSHHDERYREALQRHLAALERQDLIAIWHDRQIDYGQEWRAEIDEKLEDAQLILLLISADFIASDYCWGIEMKRALERHEMRQATVIPVIVRPVDWDNAPFGKLQALPDEAKPISTWANADEAMANVAKGIRKAATALAAGLIETRDEAKQAGGPRAPLVSESRASRVQIRFSAGDVRTFESDVLILKYAQAFYGVDKAVALQLSDVEPDLETFRVPLGEYRVFDTRGRLQPSQVLYAGVQPLVYLDYAAIERFASGSLDFLGGTRPHTRHASITLHGAGYGLDERESLSALLRGMIRSIAGGRCPGRLEHVTLVERDERRLERILKYLDEFHAREFENVSGRLANRTLVIQARGRPGETGPEPGARHTLRREQRRSLFAAMPFAEEFDDVYHFGIQSAAHANNLLCERGDAASFTGDVVERVKNGIQSADLVVADLTGGNPNVYLEVGYAWGCRKPTILLVRNTGDLKFDVKTQRCLVYKTIRGLRDLLSAEIAALRSDDGN